MWWEFPALGELSGCSHLLLFLHDFKMNILEIYFKLLTRLDNKERENEWQIDQHQ